VKWFSEELVSVGFDVLHGSVPLQLNYSILLDKNTELIPSKRFELCLD
jgi:hypothetical protein